MAKTVAVREETWERMRKLLDAGDAKKYRRLNREFGSKYDFVRARTTIVPLEEELARAAGELNFERKKRVKGWGMTDSIVLATARRAGSKIVTGDPHFKDLVEETVIL